MDGFWQQLTAYESTNTKRLITGLLFGFGFVRTVFYAVLELPSD